MTCQPVYQTITIRTLPNISRTKGNQAMKFVQLIECNKLNNFLQKSCRKYDMETSSRPLSVFKKALCEVKASG